jgi:hypothetical protein
MTVFEFQATRIERIAEALAHFVATTEPDKLEWRVPLHGAQTRTILELVGECIIVNRYAAALLRGETDLLQPRFDGDMPAPFADAVDAQSQLISSAAEVAAAVRGLTEGALDREYPHYRGPMKGHVLLEMPYRNMAYHAGQVNFIQTLYGDTEFHVPENWRK